MLKSSCNTPALLSNKAKNNANKLKKTVQYFHVCQRCSILALQKK